MPYPEIMIHGMRAELAQLGIEETKTTEAVKDAVENTDGTVMVIVNSVCGCAAGGVRPGIAMALANSEAKPDRAITVFAGADIDATDTAREYFVGYAPSLPSAPPTTTISRSNVATSKADRLSLSLRPWLERLMLFPERPKQLKASFLQWAYFRETA